MANNPPQAIYVGAPLPEATIPSIDYFGVQDSQDVEQLQVLEQRITELRQKEAHHTREAMLRRVEIGRELNSVKRLIPQDGEFRKFQEQCGVKARQARRWMQAAKFVDLNDLELAGNRSLRSFRALQQLVKESSKLADDVERVELLKFVVDSEAELSARQIRRLAAEEFRAHGPEILGSEPAEPPEHVSEADEYPSVDSRTRSPEPTSAPVASVSPRPKRTTNAQSTPSASKDPIVASPRSPTRQVTFELAADLLEQLERLRVQWTFENLDRVIEALCREGLEKDLA